MWPFRRRPKGRHALGAAVTSIPSAPPVRAAVPPPPPPPAPEAPAPEAAPEAPAPEAAPEAVAPEAVAPQPVAPASPAGPRVELGFRDGSTAALAPWSEQAKALTDLAQVLTQRD